MIRSVVSQQDRAIAGRKQGLFLARSGDCEAAGVRTQGAIIELGQFTNTLPNARADTQRPQDAPFAKLDILTAPSRLKILDVLRGGSCKEKQLIEVALTSQVSFARRKSQVLGQLARGKRTQRDHGDTRFSGKRLQSVRGSGLLFGYWKARKAAQADGGFSTRVRRRSLGTQMKIILGQENAAAIFGDERVSMSEFAAWFIHLEASAAGKPH